MSVEHYRHMVYTTHQITAASLVTLAVLTTATRVDIARNNGLKAGAKIKYLIDSKDGTQGDGPLLVGFADGTMTAAQIQEVFAADPQGPADLVPQERLGRHVWPVGWVRPGSVNAAGQFTAYRTLTWPWDISEEEGLFSFIFNCGSGTVTADGSVVIFHTRISGEWLRD